MNARDAFRLGMDMGNMVGMNYLQDLSDSDLLLRPHPKCNHVNWQVGHLIVSEHGLVNSVKPNSMPELPPGFAEKYSKENAGSDRPEDFATKDQLLQAYQQQRAASLQVLDTLSDTDFEKQTGLSYAPTVGAIFALLANHWLMHAGQWVIVRRQLGRPPLF